MQNRFDPKAEEAKIYARWEEEGCFRPQGEGEPYSIVIPPPNVTGVLHMGHALNNTLQDVLIRFERMRGKRVLWQPGTDHAGIATQMVVERQLAEEGKTSRAEMGREAFIDRVWQWKEESGGQIMQQLKRLGASCDWSREAFTMGDKADPDNNMMRAVRKVFVELYNTVKDPDTGELRPRKSPDEKGLIYRDKRLVNWDPHFQTAISDLEVENKETGGKFWHFKYPLADGETYTHIEKDADGNITLEEERDYISIATTRPETMLGDGAVAVHPSDERYAPIVGKMVKLPLADRLIPIITDHYPDPEFGSGAVKITGAHDFNDYMVAKRNNLPLYSLMGTMGEMIASEIMPEKYVGMDRFECRKEVVNDIDALGLLAHTEDKKIMQPIGDRSGVVIEPMLTDQWYVDAEVLAEKAVAAVNSGETTFHPKERTADYLRWMENIEPWCISRQLWWGHQIPAWFGPRLTNDKHNADGKILFVADDEDEAFKLAENYYPNDVTILRSPNKLTGSYVAGNDKLGPVSQVFLARDPDVLDTWFSSALWPFSTMGWPDNTEEVNSFYPTSTLVTAHDIIFFWVARMMMQGTHFMDAAPFKYVYIHALILDEKGAKMSKSKGNVVDPIDLLDEYGADALRFYLTAMSAQGRNIRLNKQQIEGYRNFSTKIWNSVRFCAMNEAAPDPSFDPSTAQNAINKWVLGELAKAAHACTEGLDNFKFNEATGALYTFVWSIFCDWYIELVKPILYGDDETLKAETRATAAYVVDEMLKLLQPFMPFVTQALWQEFGQGRDSILMVEGWPTLDFPDTSEAAEELGWVIATISEIRSARAALGVPSGTRIKMSLLNPSVLTQARADTHGDIIGKRAFLSEIGTATTAPEGGVTLLVGGESFCLHLAGVIDFAEEKKRLDKKLASLTKEIKSLEGKLKNEKFVARAPAEIVEKERATLADLKDEFEKLNTAAEQLGA